MSTGQVRSLASCGNARNPGFSRGWRDSTPLTRHFGGVTVLHQPPAPATGIGARDPADVAGTLEHNEHLAFEVYAAPVQESDDYFRTLRRQLEEALQEGVKRSISLETLAEVCQALNESPSTVIRDCIKPVHASEAGSMLQDLVRERKLERPATISMIMCSGVSEAEQARLQALDNEVSKILLTRSANRHFWIGREVKGERRVELRSTEGVTFSIASRDFAAISDQELLKRIATGQR